MGANGQFSIKNNSANYVNIVPKTTKVINNTLFEISAVSLLTIAKTLETSIAPI